MPMRARVATVLVEAKGQVCPSAAAPRHGAAVFDMSTLPREDCIGDIVRLSCVRPCVSNHYKSVQDREREKETHLCDGDTSVQSCLLVGMSPDSLHTAA